MATEDLTIQATVADELGVLTASVPARLITAASRAIRTYLGRPLLYSAAIAEYVPGHGRQRLILDRTPVVSITSILIDGTVVEATDYSIEDADAGLVYRLGGWPFTGTFQPGIVQHDWLAGSETKTRILATYAGGWVTPGQNLATPEVAVTLPADIEQAAIETVVAMYNGRGSDPRIASESLGSATVSYKGRNTGIGAGLGGVIPDSALGLLEGYRRIR